MPVKFLCQHNTPQVEVLFHARFCKTSEGIWKQFFRVQWFMDGSKDHEPCCKWIVSYCLNVYVYVPSVHYTVSPTFYNFAHFNKKLLPSSGEQTQGLLNVYLQILMLTLDILHFENKMHMNCSN